METTRKANWLLQTMTKSELAERIGISRPTLDTRLAQHNWKKGEISLIYSMAKVKI